MEKLHIIQGKIWYFLIKREFKAPVLLQAFSCSEIELYSQKRKENVYTLKKKNSPSVSSASNWGFYCTLDPVQKIIKLLNGNNHLHVTHVLIIGM